MTRRKQTPDPAGYKTEEQLKEEARRRAAEAAALAASRPPPPPRRQRAENFWYHYKWHTAGAVLVLALALFFLRDVVFRTDPDLTLILATSTPVSNETMDALQDALEEAAADFNADGKVSVGIDYIYMRANPSAEEEAAANNPGEAIADGADYASVMKLTMVIAAGSDPLFLIDEGMVSYFENIARSGEYDEVGNYIREEPSPEDIYRMFDRLEIPGAEGAVIPVKATAITDIPGCEALSDHAFALRTAQKETGQAYRDYCLELLRTLAE